MKKIQLGCGSNFLDGWENYDKEIDITKQLPFNNNSVDFLFTEHCIEHIEFEQFNSFLKECFRILNNDGIIRLATPCIDKIIQNNDEEYIKWCNDRYSKKIPTFGNMLNLMFNGYGHKYLYDKETLSKCLINNKFKDICFYEPGESEKKELKNLENHWKKIGKKFNDLETIAVEAIVIKKEEKY